MHPAEWLAGGKGHDPRNSASAVLGGFRSPWHSHAAHDPHANHKMDLASEGGKGHDFRNSASAVLGGFRSPWHSHDAQDPHAHHKMDLASEGGKSHDFRNSASAMLGGFLSPWHSHEAHDPHASHKMDLATENMRLRQHLDQRRKDRGQQRPQQVDANGQASPRHWLGHAVFDKGLGAFSRQNWQHQQDKQVLPPHEHSDAAEQRPHSHATSFGAGVSSLTGHLQHGFHHNVEGDSMQSKSPRVPAAASSFNAWMPSDYVHSSSSRSAPSPPLTPRSSAGATTRSLRGMQKLPKELQELLTPRLEVIQSIVPAQVLDSQLPNDDDDRRKEVIAHCTEIYLKGQLNGFEVMMPSKIFGGDSLERETISVAPALPSRSSDFCWSCGSKLEAGATSCHKCKKACSESDVCCGRPLPPDSTFCRRCGTQRATEFCMFCGKTLGSKNKFCDKCGRPRNPPRPPQVCKCGQKIVGEVQRCVKCKEPVVKPKCACGSELRPDAKFCRVCGKTFCKSCGSSLAADAMFCDTCGKRYEDGAGHSAFVASPLVVPLANISGNHASQNGVMWPDHRSAEGAGKDRDEFFFHPAQSPSDPPRQGQTAK